MEASNLIDCTNVESPALTNYDLIHIWQEITTLYSYP
jgi:hypothetical protein